ncbi:MAG TPA: hypothetical protein VD886_02590, partial [Herpetosiphonaceae bacterium]|nr:hypothetical protein [Herpetosiphonaceae bacterium]
TYTLQVVVHANAAGGDTQSFQILDSAQAVVFAAAEEFSLRDTTYFLWDAADRVWVYSGDVGTFFWERGADGAWNKSVYATSSVPAPQFLKDTRPKYHPR